MKQYKTVLIDFDGTLLDTSILSQYRDKVRQYKRYSPEWHQARKELLGHIADCPPYDGWPEIWKYLEEHHIQAAIVTSRGHDILNRAVKAEGVEQMKNDPDHPCITTPRQIIDILEKTATEI